MYILDIITCTNKVKLVLNLHLVWKKLLSDDTPLPVGRHGKSVVENPHALRCLAGKVYVFVQN